MVFLYNFSVSVYFFLVKLFSLRVLKARLLSQGLVETRKKLSQFEGFVNGQKVVWMHVSSLGEFEQGRPLLEAIRAQYPSYKIVLTFFSPSGYEIRKNFQGADLVLYLLPDTRSNARYFLNKINPTVAIFVKYEFWYHHLRQLKQNNVPTYLISGIFRPNQVFFRFYGAWYKSWLHMFTHLYVQNTSSLQLLQDSGIGHASVAPDTRFDRVYSIANTPRDIRIASEFSATGFVIVAGSTWPPDEQLIINEVNNSTANTKYIIAPHEIQESHIAAITSRLRVPYLRYSQAANETLADKRVLIIDNIGMLSALYKYGQVAYIGGGFGKGIHNILEAAVYGVPVLFGPKYKKFQEALDLTQNGGALVIHDQGEYNHLVEKLATDAAFREKAAKTSGNYVSENTGGTNIILDALGLQ